MLMAAAACGGGADSGAEGSGGGSDDPVTLTVMRNPPELTPEQVKEFEAEHPNIKLTLLDSDPTKLKSLQAAGNAPDVFRVQGPEVPQLVTQRQLLDLTDRFESSDLLAPDDLAPANDLYEIDGKRYGAVKDWSPDYTVFINNALFEQAGVPCSRPGHLPVVGRARGPRQPGQGRHPRLRRGRESSGRTTSA
jgi:multiple sugar transport system substrate-binding protein